MLTSPSMLPPIMYSSLSFCGKHGSSLTARAKLESGPRATRETCREHSVTPHPTADTPCRMLFHLVLVFSHQTDHCIDCILFLDLLFPLWVSVFNHIPKSIGSKVVSTQVIGSNQGTSAASKDWNLQYASVLICNIFVFLLG